MGQEPAHHAIWIREKPDGVPPANACLACPCSLFAVAHDARWGTYRAVVSAPELANLYRLGGSRPIPGVPSVMDQVVLDAWWRSGLGTG